MFIGREQELKILNDLYGSPRFELPIIYGRRRIGKTVLIQKFLEGKRAIYFQGIENSAQNNLERLSKKILDFQYGQVDEALGFSSFDDAFKRIDELAKNERLVFVIDEYPYLAKAYPGISSILQEMIDHVFLKNENLMFILLGSSMSFMQRQVLGYKSPLYGRRSAQLKILPFGLNEVRKFFPNLSAEELVTYFGITGGIPFYLGFINPSLSVEENITKLFLHPASYLLEEPNNLLKQERNEPATYNAVLDALAETGKKINYLATRTGFTSSAVTKYLKTLIELGIVVKKVPTGENKKKKTLYQISDGMFRFWYRFIDAQQERITRGNISALKTKIIKELPDFLGQTFEEIAISWLWNADRQGKIKKSISKLGSWWGNNPKKQCEEEIDIVGLDEGGMSFLFGECKWRNKILGESTLNKLVERSLQLPAVEREYYLFSKIGFSKKLQNKEQNYHFITIEEMLDV